MVWSHAFPWVKGMVYFHHAVIINSSKCIPQMVHFSIYAGSITDLAHQINVEKIALFLCQIMFGLKSSVWGWFPIHCEAHCSNQCSSCLLTRMSSKDYDLLFLMSIANLMFWWMLIRKSKNFWSSSPPCGHNTKVSSVYLNQCVSLQCAVLSASSSKCSIQKCVITRASGKPMAAPSVCSQNIPSKRK